MALPKIDVPVYHLKLPSSGERVNFQPFRMREEKMLYMALQDDDVQHMVDTLKQIIRNCVQTELDVDALPLFDLEYIFLKLRAKSVGEMVDIQIQCPECEGAVPVKVDLENVEVQKDKNHTSTIQITDNVGVKMKYMTVDMMMEVEQANLDDYDTAKHLMMGCIDAVFDDEGVQKIGQDATTEELEEFLDNLTQQHLEKINEFFNTLPVLRKDIPYTCPNVECEHSDTFTVEGLKDFFH